MYVIGLDIGGTKIKGVIANKKGKILAEEKIPTEAEKGQKKVANNIVQVIKKLRSKFKDSVSAVGISIPGFIDSSGKMIFGGGSLSCLVGLNLEKNISKRIGLPVFVENDANCFALAEAVYGSGRGHKVVVGVIWGTGIGGGIIINKHIFEGSIGGAGEFGHIVIDPTIKKGPRCGCGQYGCLEILSSGKNIVRQYRDGGGKINLPTATDIYKSKEKIAQKVISQAIERFSHGLAILVNILNPDVIVIGGGVSHVPMAVYRQIEKNVKKYALKSLTKDLSIKKYSISDDEGVLGAVALAFSHSKNNVANGQ